MRELHTRAQTQMKNALHVKKNLSEDKTSRSRFMSRSRMSTESFLKRLCNKISDFGFSSEFSLSEFNMFREHSHIT